MTIARIGRYSLSPESDWDTIPANAERITTFNGITDQLIVMKGGFYGGRSSGGGTPSTKVLVYYTSFGLPGDRVAFSNLISPGTSFNGSGGNAYEADFATPFVLDDNLEVGIGLSALNYSLAVSGRGDSVVQPPAKYTSFYNQNIGSADGVATFAGTQAASKGHQTVWLTGDINVPPNTPGSVGPSGSVATLTPTMTATFSDANQTLSDGRSFDKMSLVSWQIRVVGAVNLFDSYQYAPSTSEKNANVASAPYAGAALTSGVAYEARCQLFDLGGLRSPWTAWTQFTPTTQGSVSIPTGFSGKQLSLTPSPFTATYTHGGGLSAKNVRARLYQGALNKGVLKQVGNIVVQTVAPGGTISMTWNQTGFTTLLVGQSDYYYTIEAQDTGNTWTAIPGPGKAFSTNATPLTPVNRAPANDAVVTALPLLTYESSDPDDPNSALVPFFYIRRANGTTVVQTGTWNATTGKYQYQMTGTDLPTFQEFYWAGYISDGYLTSDMPSLTHVVYASGPSTSITAPTAAQVVADGQLLATWSTVATQTHYRMKLWEGTPGVGALRYDSKWVASTGNSHQFTAGDYENLKSYTMELQIRLASLAEGSFYQSFSTSYPGIATLTGVDVQSIRFGLESWASSVQMKWVPPNTITPVAFDHYRITRWKTAEGSDYKVVLAEPRRIAQSSFTDYRPVNGVDYTYGISYFAWVSGSLVQSPTVTLPGRVDFKGVVISSLTGGRTYRAELLFDLDRSHELKQDKVKQVPIGASKGRTNAGPLREWDVSSKFRLVTDSYGTARQREEQVRALASVGGTVNYRDERGRSYYMTIDACKIKDLPLQKYEVEFSFSEEDIDEGVV